MEQVTIRLDAFEGPMDLLYHLIEKNEIDIYDIPIASLTDQYLAYLDAAEDRNMDGMSEFLVMAATLLEIKSKLLLPKPKKEAEEEGPDPRAELVERLLEYKKIKGVTAEWKARAEEAARLLYKPADKAIAKLRREEDQPLEDFLMGVTMEDLYLAFQEVMQRKESKVDHVRSSFRAVERDLFTIQDKMDYIRDLLILQPQITFFGIRNFPKKKSYLQPVFLTIWKKKDFVSQKESQGFRPHLLQSGEQENRYLDFWQSMTLFRVLARSRSARISR